MILNLERYKHLPRFADGRVDYTTSHEAPVLSIFIVFKDELLILKRSQKVLAYKGKWNVVGGYIDEEVELQDKVLEELREELNIKKDIIQNIKFGKPKTVRDKDRLWHVHPVLVQLKNKPKIELDFEHTEFKWIKKESLKDFDTVPGIEKEFIALNRTCFYNS